jgi:endoglucanase
MKMLDSKGVKYQKVCEPFHTSTNSDGVSVAGRGVRTVLMSVPLRSMHTPSEAVCLDDIKSLSDILLEVAYTEKEAL